VRVPAYILSTVGRRFSRFEGRRREGDSNEGGTTAMATYRDPVRVFAPLEVVERLLEIREDAGYSSQLFIRSSEDLAAYFDAYGFDVYAFDNEGAEFQFGDYRAAIAPGGDYAHSHETAH
jgi:hypothetical protein